MRHALFQVAPPFNYVWGLAIEIKEGTTEYDVFLEDNEEAMESIINDIINTDLSAAAAEMFSSYGYNYSESENAIYVCVLPSLPIPDFLFEAMLELIIENTEMFDSASGKGTTRNKPVNYYKLEKLSDLYRLPVCKGRVLEENNTYYLETTCVLDDFLDKVDRVLPHFKCIVEDTEIFFKIFSKKCQNRPTSHLFFT